MLGLTTKLAMKPIAAISLAAISLHAAVPSHFIGARACAACHPAEFASQSAGAHAGALSPVPERPDFPAGKLSRDPRYRFEILPAKPGLHVRIHDGLDLMDLPFEWAFGAGRQAVTFVTRVNQDWYVEHYATWYPGIHSYGPTPGQEELHPKSMAEAAGLLYRISDAQFGIRGCFECHSTGPVSFDHNGAARINEPGVHCEACHGPGSAHAAGGGRSRLTVPAQLSPGQLNDFCGRCHRRPPDKNATSIDWNYSWNVRHQPAYLSQSQCFRKSNGRLSCLTCHDPHGGAAPRSAASFDAKCAQCHAACAAKQRANCIDCHMPRVSPQPPLRFTNHWIGIYRMGGKLRPVR